MKFGSNKRMERAADPAHAEDMKHDEQLWEAIQRRDRNADGRFFFGVVTTGVYCRPSCPSRRPLRQNVRFYSSPQEAERDGLRPCLRCRPLERDRRIAQLCRYIEQHSDERIDLAELAARAGLSRFHVQRAFKAAVGVTPKQYVEACRVRQLKQGLRHAKDVTEAVYEAGFGSASRVYERADDRLGMTPSQYRRGGRGVAITYATFQSPLGLAMIGATDRGVCFLQFGESEAALRKALSAEYPEAELTSMPAPTAEFRKWIAALNRYLAGARTSLDLPLDIRATAFQTQVWTYLQSIPRGEVRSYSEVAEGIGRPSAARAVARACASNTIAIAVPCHRVIRGTGGAGGYRWGVERKEKLLALERA
jgi:AraC family transcriptional regulator of adaptative response/methylated-DNA-[protein]-cysteine methyltransferase